MNKITKKIKKIVDEVLGDDTETKLQVFVLDQTGKIVKKFDNVEEAYKFAGENGYQVLS